MTCCDIHPRKMSPENEERELEGDPLDLVPHKQLVSQSDVASFFDGTCVFITGATGFLGTSLLEKLLRACTGISKVYVLVRDKKGIPLQERMRLLLDGIFFGKMRDACPDYLRKVEPIAGDCVLPGLGLSAADADLLAREVGVVFHVAATVRFDESLRVAAAINVRATRDLLQLTRRMPNLKAFVHMSTAYSNCHVSEIEEKIYPPRMNTEELLKLVEVLDDGQLSQILPLVLGDSPNTYAFTKAVAEDTMRSHGRSLPACIVRPSIVVSTAREPLVLWLGNIYGPIGVLAGAGLGVVHTMQADVGVRADLVPVDLVTNATIACAWDTWCRHSTLAQTLLATGEPVIYNCVSTTRHPMSWDTIHKFAKEPNFPLMRNFWYAYCVTFKQKSLYVIGAVICHLIPAIIADTFLHLRGMKPILWNLYSRIHGVSQALEPFMMREWTFKDDNLVSLIGRLGAVDRKLFPCDITEVDFEWHYSNIERGMRLYILKESYDNVDAARKKYRWLTVLHYTMVTIFVVLVVLMLWRILIFCLSSKQNVMFST